MENLKLGTSKGRSFLSATHQRRRGRCHDEAHGHGRLILLGVVVFGFYIFNVRSNRPLGQAIARIEAASQQTASEAGEISAASQTLAEGASEQAASLQETSASLEEMSSMTKRNADNAERQDDRRPGIP